MTTSLSEADILEILDNSAKDGSAGFVSLGHVYSYLVDSRINLFKGKNGQWAIAVERLGYNPRAGSVLLDIHYYGNCLKNLQTKVNKQCGINTYLPIEKESFLQSTTDEETVKPGSGTWIVRGKAISIAFSKRDYTELGIKVDTADGVGVEAVMRVAAKRYQDLFRATDNELYAAIPDDMKKLMVVDEWFHKDFYLFPMEDMVADYKKHNQKIWENNRPSSYETWKLLAKVLVTENISLYKPTMQANSHWKNWLDSGSL